jgi:hypothetical protein
MEVCLEMQLSSETSNQEGTWREAEDLEGCAGIAWCACCPACGSTQDEVIVKVVAAALLWIMRLRR